MQLYVNFDALIRFLHVVFRELFPVNLIRDYEALNSTATLEESKVSNASEIMAARVVDMP